MWYRWKNGVCEQTTAEAIGRIAGNRLALGHLPSWWGPGTERDRHDYKRSAAFGADLWRQARSGGRGRRRGFGASALNGGQLLAGVFQSGALAMMEEAELADYPLALGWHMDQKPVDELLGA